MPKLQTSGLALEDGSWQKGRMEDLIFLVRVGSRKKSNQKTFHGYSRGMGRRRESSQRWRR